MTPATSAWRPSTVSGPSWRSLSCSPLTAHLRPPVPAASPREGPVALWWVRVESTTGISQWGAGETARPSLPPRRLWRAWTLATSALGAQEWVSVDRGWFLTFLYHKSFWRCDECYGSSSQREMWPHTAIRIPFRAGVHVPSEVSRPRLCRQGSIRSSCGVCLLLVSQVFPTLCEPRACSTPGLPVLHCLPELAQTHVHWASDATQQV